MVWCWHEGPIIEGTPLRKVEERTPTLVLSLAGWSFVFIYDWHFVEDWFVFEWYLVYIWMMFGYVCLVFGWYMTHILFLCVCIFWYSNWTQGGEPDCWRQVQTWWERISACTGYNHHHLMVIPARTWFIPENNVEWYFAEQRTKRSPRWACRPWQGCVIYCN